jgi:hypothetical protein
MAKKKKDTEGTGEDQGTIGQARHDLASAFDIFSGAYDPVQALPKAAKVEKQGVDPDALIAAADPMTSYFAAQAAGSELGAGAKEIGNLSKSGKPTKPPESADQKEIDKLKGELAAANKGGSSPSDAYTQLADQQAQQYMNMIGAANPLTSGSALPAIEGTASQQASQELGQSATSPTSQWLNAQTQAAQAQNAPVAAAMSQTGQAENSAAWLLNSGMQNMGQAEDKMLQEAPYQQLLNTLAADIPYKLLGGSATFPQLQGEVASAVSAIPGLSTTAVPTAAAASAPAVNPGIIPPAPTAPGYSAPGVGG